MRQIKVDDQFQIKVDYWRTHVGHDPDIKKKSQKKNVQNELAGMILERLIRIITPALSKPFLFLRNDWYENLLRPYIFPVTESS